MSQDTKPGVTGAVSLRYSEAGQGTPLVLLHGFPLSGASHNAAAETLGHAESSC
jgi:pimeloyl-ACP methyl ester carboxylesterase